MSGRSDESREIEALVKNAAAGSRPAQDRLIEAYWPLIRGAVRARKRRLGVRTKSRDETRDLQQDAALRVLSELDEHRWQGRSAFAAWIRRLAGLEVVDAHRRNTAQKRDAGQDEALSGHENDPTARTEDLVDARLELKKLVRQLDGLKPEHSAALLMYRLGFAHREIGETLSCSSEAARKLVMRAKSKLDQVRE